MKISSTSLKDVKLIEPKIFKDNRGFFYESFNQDLFLEKVCRDITFVQDNHSQSYKGVLRGLHYQIPPHAQAKLIRVVSGEIFDVAVDIRKSSHSFGKWVGEFLSAENKKQLWIPEGFAHGFFVLSSHAEVIYKASSFYKNEFERSIRWNDPDLGIDWLNNGTTPLLSIKDSNASEFSKAELFE